MIGEGGNNGKTTFFEALTDILPIYAYKTDSELIEKKGRDKHKYIAGLKGKRFVWLDEMEKEKKLDEKMLKLLGEGTSIDYKVMYGETASLKNRFKLFMITNHEPNFKTDGGLNNRTKVLKFDSTFSKDTEEDNYAELDFKVDNSIGDKWRTTHKLAIINILFNYAKDYYDDDCKLKPYPSQFQKETSELLENNDSFRMWFNNHFEINPSGRCSREDVESRLPQDVNGKKGKNPRSDMKRLGYKYEGTLNCGKDAEGKKIQGGYKGFVLKKVSCFPAFGIQEEEEKYDDETEEEEVLVCDYDGEELEFQQIGIDLYYQSKLKATFKLVDGAMEEQ